MPLPYETSSAAWRFVIVIHRLAAVSADFIRISPAADSSLSTARSKLFQGRQYIFTAADDPVHRYSDVAVQTRIHTEDHCLKLEKLERFAAAYSDLPADDFTNVYRQIMKDFMATTGTIYIPSFPTLSRPQLRALEGFLSGLPGVKMVGIQATSIVINR